MTHGIDTDFLVAAEIRDHPFHRPADELLQSLLAFHQAGVKRMITNNERDFRCFGCFDILTFQA